MKEKEDKVVYVLDLFHLIEKKMGDERIQGMSLTEILELRDDTVSLIEGNISVSEFEKWKI